jgi:peptidyl-prolyl cis-trans isomerase D
VQAFETAAYALRPGELSQPVLSPFGYHLIRVDERKGDTLDLRHILVRIGQSDSSATRTDRRADELSRLAGGATEPARFDSAARRLGLPVQQGVVFEHEPMTLAGRPIPDASAFAFGGARVGETSELLSDDNGYYLARIDSLDEGNAREIVRRELLQQKKLEQLVPRAQRLAQAAVGSSLEAAAQAQGVPLDTTPMFTRVSPVPGLGRLNQAIGAAFGLPVGAVSAPITTPQAVVVLRVDRRLNADRAEFEAQKDMLRAQYTQGLRQQAFTQFLENLRRSARIDDRRREVLARGRGNAES